MFNIVVVCEYYESEHRDAVMVSSFVLHLRRTLDPKREEARQKMVIIYIYIYIYI